MADIYILDSSAMGTLNELAADDESMIDRLVDLRDSGALLYCGAVKEERRTLAKGEPITIWAVSGWRSIQSRAVVNFTSVQAVLMHFPPGGIYTSVMDMDFQEDLDQQALATVALAHQLKDSFEVYIVSDELFTSENRCTVIEACAVAQIKHLTVDDFLQATPFN